MTAFTLYQLLVRLHPRAFRERFGPEMLCIFEEAADAGRMELFADCVLSIARQWLLRSALWIVAVAALAALAQMALAGTAWLAVAERALSTRFADLWSRGGPLPAEAALLLASAILTAILLAITLVASRISRRASSTSRRSIRRAGAAK